VLSASALLGEAHAQQESKSTAQHIQVRFVLTHRADQDGKKTRTSVETAVILQPGGRIETTLKNRYKLALKTSTVGSAVQIETSLVDLARDPSSEMYGSSLIEIGQGSGIGYAGTESQVYTLGLLVTSAPPPVSAA
jgi:hypothetical protein